MQGVFHRFAGRVSGAVGSPLAFVASVALIGGWLGTGPLFGFSDTWQLIINTSTTIVTFLMVFLIQHTQNRDARAIHLKLDELIRATKGARNTMIDLDALSDEKLTALEAEYKRLCQADPEDVEDELEQRGVAPRKHHRRATGRPRSSRTDSR